MPEHLGPLCHPCGFGSFTPIHGSSGLGVSREQCKGSTPVHGSTLIRLSAVSWISLELSHSTGGVGQFPPSCPRSQPAQNIWDFDLSRDAKYQEGARELKYVVGSFDTWRCSDKIPLSSHRRDRRCPPEHRAHTDHNTALCAQGPQEFYIIFWNVDWGEALLQVSGTGVFSGN